jgi:hypothetical protein
MSTSLSDDIAEMEKLEASVEKLRGQIQEEEGRLQLVQRRIASRLGLLTSRVGIVTGRTDRTGPPQRRRSSTIDTDLPPAKEVRAALRNANLATNDRGRLSDDEKKAYKSIMANR